jgi:arginine-tRNA-protein transferase
MIHANRHVALYLSAPHACSYLQDRQSSTLFTDPAQPMDMPTYTQLLQHGFRRSGSMVYAPRCEHCTQCLSVRIPVDDFVARRIHRRILRANQDIEVREAPAEFDPVHYALYRQYTAARHEDGDMADASPDDYLGFLRADWCDTRFLEFRIGGRVVAVAVTDLPEDGLSAVYTFFDPGLAARSLGTLAILTQIERTRALGLPHLYLGYWIRDSRKMAYKAGFRPLELWHGARWRRFGPGDMLPGSADKPANVR